MDSILCPLDFSACSRRALQVAMRIAHETGAELELVHAWDRDAIAQLGPFPLQPVALAALEADRRASLAAAVSEASAGGARTTSRLLIGTPWLAILEAVETDRSIRLVVMGTHGESARFVLGSVTERVIRHVPCSTLVVREHSPVTPFRRILCPTDFSDGARHALDRAARLVAPGGSIEVLHAIDLPALPAGSAAEIEGHATVQLGAAVDRVATRPDLHVTSRFVVGRPAAKILDALAEDREIDLVVLGSHGRSARGRPFLGSVAEAVVRHATCPVLVERAPHTHDA